MPDHTVDRAAGPCPDVETLAAYVDGLLGDTDRAAVQAHVARCADCFDLVSEVSLAQDEIPELRVQAAPEPRPALRFEPRRAPRRSIAWLAAAALAMGAITLGLWSWRQEHGRAPDGQFAALVAALGDKRPIEARLTGGFKDGPVHSPTGSVQGSSDTLNLLAAAGELQRRAEREPDASALHAWGVAQLLIGEYDGAVDALTRAASARPADARLQSDLAAAYMSRARRSNRPDDWRLALDAADRAIALDGSVLEALYNRALALTGMNLRDQAHDAWKAYLEKDSSSPWAEEARRVHGKRAAVSVSPGTMADAIDGGTDSGQYSRARHPRSVRADQRPRNGARATRDLVQAARDAREVQRRGQRTPVSPGGVDRPRHLRRPRVL